VAVPTGVAAPAMPRTANETVRPARGFRVDASFSVAVMVTLRPTTGDESDFSMMRDVGDAAGAGTGPVRSKTAWRMPGRAL